MKKPISDTVKDVLKDIYDSLMETAPQSIRVSAKNGVYSVVLYLFFCYVAAYYAKKNIPDSMIYSYTLFYWLIYLLHYLFNGFGRSIGYHSGHNIVFAVAFFGINYGVLKVFNNLNLEVNFWKIIIYEVRLYVIAGFLSYVFKRINIWRHKRRIEPSKASPDNVISINFENKNG